MRADDDLLVGGENSLHQSRMFFRGDFCVSGEAAEIVHSFKQDDPAHAGGGEDVAVETGESVGAEAVGEQMIAADALVGDADGVGAR